jgi:SET domain-containing protein
LGGQLVLSGDHARFLNHSDDPNTQARPFLSIARRSIASGDEITCDYGAFCVDWKGLDD